MPERGAISRPRSLRRAEHDDQPQLLGDVVEPMRHARRDEDRVARADVAGLGAGGEPAAAREDHVDLVLGVRLLAVDGAGLEHVQPERQVRHAEELELRAARGRLAVDELREGEDVHPLRYAERCKPSAPSTSRPAGRTRPGRRVRRGVRGSRHAVRRRPTPSPTAAPRRVPGTAGSAASSAAPRRSARPPPRRRRRSPRPRGRERRARRRDGRPRLAPLGRPHPATAPAGCSSPSRAA